MVQMNQFAGQKERHSCREQTYGHQRGESGRRVRGGGVNWEIGIDIYTLICIKLLIRTCCIKNKQNSKIISLPLMLKYDSHVHICIHYIGSFEMYSWVETAVERESLGLKLLEDRSFSVFK